MPVPTQGDGLSQFLGKRPMMIGSDGPANARMVAAAGFVVGAIEADNVGVAALAFATAASDLRSKPPAPKEPDSPAYTRNGPQQQMAFG